jgi:sialate O-acetylesterase
MMKKTIIAAAVVASAFAAEAKVATATPFADNMVLQRGRAVPVWGTADAGESVTVSFAGQVKSATADAKGAWRVMLDPMPASKENRVLKVSGSANAEEIKNVLVGEVWFASGQSNMECPIWGPSPRYRDGQGAVMTASARRPFIRYAKNGRAWKVEPRYDWKAVWRDYSPASFKETFGYNLSAVAFYYALELYDALEVPVGIIDSSWGGTCIETWTPLCSYKTPPEISATGKRAHQQPTALWNGMVAAWAPFAIKGFIWYQGCSNAGQGRRYSERMHALYDGWAKEFQNPDLKLYFVQLAPFSRSWFEVQQGQAKFAAEEKNAGMAVINDIGNLRDIHPNEKEMVGKRLALHALKRDYGFTDIEADSPTLKEWKVEGDKFVLTFDHAKSLYVYNPDRSFANGFELAGEDGVFKPAKIVNRVQSQRGNGQVAYLGTLEGAQIVVSADGVAEPKKLRYLYSAPWFGSIYNEVNLPLGSFHIGE